MQEDRRTFTFRLAVEVDESVWEHVYGPSGTVREDVESYIIAALSQSSAADEGAIVTAQVIGR